MAFQWGVCLCATVAWQGTRSALFSNKRESITLTINDVTPATVGAIIALYERAVGLYAALVNVNAYHQPGEDRAEAMYTNR